MVDKPQSSRMTGSYLSIVILQVNVLFTLQILKLVFTPSPPFPLLKQFVENPKISSLLLWSSLFRRNFYCICAFLLLTSVFCVLSSSISFSLLFPSRQSFFVFNLVFTFWTNCVLSHVCSITTGWLMVCNLFRWSVCALVHILWWKLCSSGVYFFDILSLRTAVCN